MVTWGCAFCKVWHRLATPASLIWFQLRFSLVTLHVAVFNALHRLATPASVIWLWPRYSVVTLDVAVCNAWHRLATPASVISLRPRSSVVTLHVALGNAWQRLQTPASVIWLLLRFNEVTSHVGVCNAWRKLATPASVIWLRPRYSVVTLHVAVCNAWHRLPTPASVIWLPLRFNEVILHVCVCSTRHRLRTPASVIRVPFRDSSISLVLGNDSAIVATHSSFKIHTERSSEVTVQKHFFSALKICRSPVCVIWQLKRVSCAQQGRQRDVLIFPAVSPSLKVVRLESPRRLTNGLWAIWRDVWLLPAVSPALRVTRLESPRWLPNGLGDSWRDVWLLSGVSTAFNVFMTSNRKVTAMQSTSVKCWNLIFPSRSLNWLESFFTTVFANSLSWYSARHFVIISPAGRSAEELLLIPSSSLCIKALSFCFDKMPDINCNTIADAFSPDGIFLCFTNQWAAKYSWSVRWVKQKCFVISEKDFLNMGPQWRRPLARKFSTSSSVNVFISSTAKRYFFSRSNWAARIDNLSIVTSGVVPFVLLCLLKNILTTSK